MRASDSKYLRSLLKLQHVSSLLAATLGIEPHSLCPGSENPPNCNPARDDARPSRPAENSGTYLDTYRGTPARGVPPEVLAWVKAELPESWVLHNAEHERVKRTLIYCLELCAQLPHPGKNNPRFKADRMAKRISLCQSSHLTMKGDDGQYMILPIACDSPFCPSCSRKKTAEQISRVESQLGVRLHSYDLRWITLTMKNVPRGELAQGLDDLLHAWRTLRQKDHGKQWDNRVRGYLWNLEVTIGKGHTWHPHIHILYDGDFWPAEDLDWAWKKRLASRGHVGKAIIGRAYYKRNGEKIYLTGEKNANVDDVLDCIVEVSKYTIAPMESRSTPAPMIYELAAALFGRRLRGSAGTMELRKGVKPPAWWTSIGSLRDVLKPGHKHFIENDAEWRKLLGAATAHRGLWLNLIRQYHPFYAAAMSEVTHEKKKSVTR